MLPPASLPMPPTWRDLLAEVAPVFARRSTRRLFVALACGMILADRSTVVAMTAAAGMANRWRRACWFFSGAVWDVDDLGPAVARLVAKYLIPPGEPLVVAVDGTFFKRWGRKVFQARWAYDGSAQGGKKVAFGNTWVVAGSWSGCRAVLLRWRCRCCSGCGAARGPPPRWNWPPRCWRSWPGRFPAARFTGQGMPPSTAGPWSLRARRGRPGCQPTRCCTGPSRLRPASGAARGSKLLATPSNVSMVIQMPGAPRCVSTVKGLRCSRSSAAVPNECLQIRPLLLRRQFRQTLPETAGRLYRPGRCPRARPAPRAARRARCTAARTRAPRGRGRCSR
jgi:hypothetical protein